MDHPICTRCGASYPRSSCPPLQCAICQDDREAVRVGGQCWTSRGAMQGHYRTVFTPLDPGVVAVATMPGFAIDQQAYLVQTEHGNVLWDCVAFLDEATVAEVRRLGGVAAIALSHPHFYSGMSAWSQALGDVPIYVHASDRQWVTQPVETLRVWEGETHALMPGLRLVRCGGHFPGSAALHWAGGAGGQGALFTGDTISVAEDHRWVSFMYSYVNDIPLSAAAVRGIAAAVAPYPFDRLYGGWEGQVVGPDARGAVLRSAKRYIAHLQG